MKLTRMLFSSQALDRGNIRHFSDGDFAVPLDSRGGLSYIDSIRLRRPAVRGGEISPGVTGDRGSRRTNPERRGLWSLLR